MRSIISAASCSLATGVDARVDGDPGMGERIAVEDRARLHGDVGAVDGSAPQRIARLPVRMDFDPAAVREHDRDAGLFGLDLELDALRAHRDHPLELEAHLIGLAQLPGNVPLSLVERMVDQRRGHDQTALGLALGDEGMESVGKFLGDEAGREPSLAPARMLHQRRQKRDVVADAVDDEGVKRGRLRVDRARAGRARG